MHEHDTNEITTARLAVARRLGGDWLVAFMALRITRHRRAFGSCAVERLRADGFTPAEILKHQRRAAEIAARLPAIIAAGAPAGSLGEAANRVIDAVGALRRADRLKPERRP